MKILLATDGTKFAQAATEMLKNLKLGDGDEVRIVSVVDIGVPLAVDIYGGYLPDTTILEKNARETAEKVVAATAERARALLDTDGVTVTTDILFGSPDGQIVETAEEMKADLIVLGSHGYKQWERLLLGSVSSSVIHHAPCSVLVVRSDHKDGE